MRYFLGVDVGGSKSHAVVADEQGCALGFAAGGAGNPNVVGYEGLGQLLCTLTARALAQAGIVPSQIAGAGLGIGGYDWDSQRQVMLDTIAPLGLSAPVEFVNDAALGIPAGTEEGWGIAVVSGSGCNCRGWDRTHKRQGRVTGYGIWTGEGAGGTELVIEALKHVAYEWTRRGPATRLTPAFVEYYDARDVDDLIEGLTTERYAVTQLAGPLVFRVAAEGDPIAQEVILWGGRELGELVNAVVRQLDFQDEIFDVVMVGSTFYGSPVLAATMQQTVLPIAPHARFVRLNAPPVVGAVLLGMEQAGVSTRELRPRLMASTNELLSKRSM